MPKISIVSPYFNRKAVFYNTLRSIKLSVVKDIEYIVVDDASSEDQRLEDLVEEFPFLKVIRVDPKDKFYVNPCIPNNMGIAAATGDIIVLQSPECFHVGDILAYIYINMRINKYLVFSCYSLSKQATEALNTINFNKDATAIYFDITTAIGGYSEDSCEFAAGRHNTWFAHSKYRPCIFNFLVALTAEDMKDLGGFNEAFFDGHSYDDTEFADRVMKNCMNVEIVDSPHCLHQYHPSVLSNIPNFTERLEKNRFLYEQSKLSNEYYTKNSFI